MGEVITMGRPIIRNGSEVRIGTFTLYIDKHFNWFQKRIIKWCFGFTVYDYSSEAVYNEVHKM